MAGLWKSSFRIESSEVVALFLEDWERGRVALSCHMTIDLLCQEMRDACVGQLRVAGFPLFTVFAVWERFNCGSVRGLGAWNVNGHSKQ